MNLLLICSKFIHPVHVQCWRILNVLRLTEGKGTSNRPLSVYLDDGEVDMTERTDGVVRCPALNLLPLGPNLLPASLVSNEQSASQRTRRRTTTYHRRLSAKNNTSFLSFSWPYSLSSNEIYPGWDAEETQFWRLYSLSSFWSAPALSCGTHTLVLVHRHQPLKRMSHKHESRHVISLRDLWSSQ